MMNQRKNTQKGNRRLPLLLTTMLLALTLLCTFAIAVSADGTDVPVTVDNLKVNLDQRADGVYTKVYDGVIDADVEVKTQPNFGGDNVTLEIDSARFDGVDAGDSAAIVVTFKLTGADAGKYETPAPVRIPVVIEKKTVTWTANGTASTTYAAGTTLYENLAVTLPGTDKLDGVLASDLAGITLGSGYTVSVNASAAGTVTGQVLVDIGNDNYVLEPLTVDVTVGKVQLTNIVWSVDDFSFIYGDAAAFAITATGYDADGNPYQMVVNYPAGYGNANANAYLITAVPADAANVELGTALNSKEVRISPASFVVSMKDATYLGDGTSAFTVGVEGELPAAVRDMITYTNKATGHEFTSTAAYGKITVVATLPTSGNFYFVDATGARVTKLEATLCINKSVIASTGPEGDAYNIIVVGEDGFSADIVANLSIPESLGRAIRGFRIHKAYSLSLSNVGAGDSFTLLISTYEELLHKNCDALSEKDLYIYEPSTGELVPATSKYTVTLKEGYYTVEGYEGSATTTFVIAPTYNVPFLLTAPGIALLILLVLALIVVLFFIGMRLRRVTRGVNEQMTIDTEGETPEVVPAEVEDVVAEDALDALAEQIAENAETAAEETEEVDVEAEKAEAMNQLMSEVAEISLDEEESTVAEEFADSKAEELKETVETEDEEPEADEDALRDAVAAALADAVNESADAEDAVAIVADEETEEEMDEVDFRTVVNEIVCGAMTRTMVLPTEDETAEETAEVAEEAPVAETAEETASTEETEDVAAIVADVVAEAFELLIADGVEPKAVEGTTKESIAEAVDAAAVEAIPEEWSEELANEVKVAVVEELAARLLVEAPAVETLAVVDEDNDDDNDDNDDDDDDGYGGFGGFGDLKLHYIDVMAEPEEYAALLEQEAAGEIRIVYRLKKSFQSRVIQSQGNVQTYYSAIKNALLSYKGNKNRISWNYEAFNKGRVHVAKVNAKLKTLYLYLALDPEELADTKYGIVDVSSKKKYASVPVLMKIKGDRKFKYALELIEKLCGEQMQLPKLETEAVDYTMEYKTTDELIEEGVIKKLAAGVPISYFEEETPAEETEIVAEAPVEEPAIEAVPATEFAVEASAEASAEETETTEG